MVKINNVKLIILPLVVIVFAMLSITCDEALPTYVAPKNVLSVHLETAEQLSDRMAPPPYHSMVRVRLVVENSYDEVFFDTVNISGTMTISWIRRPLRVRNIQIEEKDFLERGLIKNRKMMLLPGQKVGIQFFWDMKSDDSVYFPYEMNFLPAADRACGVYLGYTVICSNPEEMMIEGSVSVFKNLAPVQVEASTFNIVGRNIIVP